MRESPSVKLMELLTAKGAIVSYSDPYIPEFPKMRNYHFDLKSVNPSDEVVASMDCVLVATDHDIFDYAGIQKNASLIVDTRGRYRHDFHNVVKA